MVVTVRRNMPQTALVPRLGLHPDSQAVNSNEGEVALERAGPGLSNEARREAREIICRDSDVSDKRYGVSRTSAVSYSLGEAVDIATPPFSFSPSLFRMRENEKHNPRFRLRDVSGFFSLANEPLLMACIRQPGETVDFGLWTVGRGPQTTKCVHVFLQLQRLLAKLLLPVEQPRLRERYRVLVSWQLVGELQVEDDR